MQECTQAHVVELSDFTKLIEKAKKEYKRALKKGYYPAKAAYEQCKVHKKAWKKSH